MNTERQGIVTQEDDLSVVDANEIPRGYGAGSMGRFSDFREGVIARAMQLKQGQALKISTKQWEGDRKEITAINNALNNTFGNSKQSKKYKSRIVGFRVVYRKQLSAFFVVRLQDEEGGAI